jgi:hypothetical protein
MVATTVAHAAMLPDPAPATEVVVPSASVVVPSASVVVPSNGAAVGTPFWENAAAAVLGVLLVLAVTGLVFALSHPRRPERSRRSEPELRA